MKKIKVGIVGARIRDTQEDKEKIKKALQSQIERFHITIVSGGCPKGGDRFAEELAKEFSLPIIIHYPNVRKGCSKHEFTEAAYARNLVIAQDSDILIATPGWSGGTCHTIDLMKNLKKPVIIL